ncbi:glutamate receptor ionotropic, delta-2-like [Homarus americanus]|uniref:glutamate receptor ionotropic, delta-2-like n=1 Tax=Homarus americanus TaxID=6706 RepID=UPI001C492112|nr:glutamate receptor ionotropic, delta-2-like [Homarus americanus]
MMVNMWELVNTLLILLLVTVTTQTTTKASGSAGVRTPHRPSGKTFSRFTIDDLHVLKQRVEEEGAIQHTEGFPSSFLRQQEAAVAAGNDTSHQDVRLLLRASALYLKRKEERKEEEEEALGSLLSAIITKELKECSLVVITDTVYYDSLALSLLTRPNLKQVVRLVEWHDLVDVSWWWSSSAGCHGNLFLLHDLSPLLTFLASPSTHLTWDFSARYILLSPSKHQLKNVTLSKIGQKTKHILGVIQTGGPGEWEVYMNQLYYGPELKHVTTWRRNTFTRQVVLFPDKLADFQGAVLKVVTFSFAPHMVVGGEGGPARYGRDFQLVTALAKVLNFSLSFTQPPGGELWGRKLDNGTWTGVVGSLERDEAHLGVANIFLSDNDNRRIVQDFTTFYDSSVNCFMARTPPPLPRWQSLAFPFTLHTWLAILASLTLVAPALYLLASSRGGEEEIMSLLTMGSSTLYTWGIHLRVSQVRVPKGTATQLLVLTLWVYAIILTTGYCSNLTAFLTVVRAPPSIDSIRELHASDLKILGIGTFIKLSMAISENPNIKGLTERFEPHTSIEEAVLEVQKGVGVFIESKKFLEYIIATKFTTRGHASMRIIKEYFAPYNVAVALQKNSPLKQNLDRVIRWAFEGGLVTRWFIDSNNLARKLQRENTGEEENLDKVEDSVIPLSLDHLQGIFFILCLCLWVSFIVFLVEMGCGRRSPRSPPRYKTTPSE